MNAPVAIPPVVALASAEIAVCLAYEGVPVRAIARSIKIPGEDVYSLLKEAIANGRLIELPKDDWPPGGRSRPQHEKNLLSRSDETLHLAAATRLKLTKLQSVVFVALLRRGEASKTYLHNAIENNRDPASDPTDPKMIDVVICHIRRRMKLAQAPIAVDTIWGVGYALKPPSRDAAIAMLAEHLAATGV